MKPPVSNREISYDSVEDASLTSVGCAFDVLFEVLPRMCIDLRLRAMRTFEQISLNYDWDGYQTSCRVYSRIGHSALSLKWLDYFEFSLVYCTMVSRSMLRTLGDL